MKVIQLNNNHFSFLPFGAKTKQEVQKEYDAIKEAIEIIAKDPSLKPTMATIAGITGIRQEQYTHILIVQNHPEMNLSSYGSRL